MSMKTTVLHTHWSAEEAYTAIDLQGLLREQLRETDGDAVVDMLREACADQARQQAQGRLELDDDIEF